MTRRRSWAPVTGGLLSLVALLAAATTLWPLFRTARWLGPVAVLCVVLAAAGAVPRVRGARAPVTLAVQLAAGFVTVTALFAPSRAVAGLLPTPGSWSDLVGVFGNGLHDVYVGTTPVDPTPGIGLLLCAGLGVTHLLVDLLVVELRAPAPAGVPLCGVPAVAGAVEAGLPPAWTLLVAALGYLVLLLRPELLVPRRRERGGAGARAPARTWWPMAVVPAVLAVALGATYALPPVDPALLGAARGWRDTTRIVVVNPVLSLRDDLVQATPREVLSYTTTRPGRPDPLRLMSLDDFTGDQWRPRDLTLDRSDRAADGLPVAPGSTSLGTGGVLRYVLRVRVGDLAQEHLPVPYPALSVVVGDSSRNRWLYDPEDLSVVGDGVTARGRTYTATVSAAVPTAARLEAAPEPVGVDARYTALPASLPRDIRTTAMRVTAGASTNYDKAVALQDWFRDSGGFTYSTSVAEADGSDAIDSFLRTREGYCVQFASAMAVMARTLGVPARVAVGFLPGTRQDDGRWSVNVRDAHAWPELYFEGTGWVRFEPTPASQSGRAPTWANARADRDDATPDTPDTTTVEPGPDGTPTTVAADDTTTAAAEDTASEQHGTTSGTTTAADRVPAVLGAVAGGLVLLALLVLGLRRGAGRWRRARRWRRATTDRDRAEAAWDDLLELAAHAGVPLAASATPREAHDVVAAAVTSRGADGSGRGRAALARVTAEVERRRYAADGTGGESGGNDARALRADLRRIDAALPRGPRHGPAPWWRRHTDRG